VLEGPQNSCICVSHLTRAQAHLQSSVRTASALPYRETFAKRVYFSHFQALPRIIPARNHYCGHGTELINQSRLMRRLVQIGQMALAQGPSATAKDRGERCTDSCGPEVHDGICLILKFWTCQALVCFALWESAALYAAKIFRIPVKSM